MWFLLGCSSGVRQVCCYWVRRLVSRLQGWYCAGVVAGTESHTLFVAVSACTNMHTAYFVVCQRLCNFVCLQDNYPEMLGRVCIINAPTVFRWIWAVVKNMIDPRTQGKIEVRACVSDLSLVLACDCMSFCGTFQLAPQSSAVVPC